MKPDDSTPWPRDSALSRRLQEHWQAQTPSLDTHAAWQRLQAQLPPARPRLSERLAQWRNVWIPTITFAGGAACALLVLAVLTATPRVPERDADTFVALSGPTPAPASQGGVLQVTFSDNARIADIEALLLQLDASLTAGPSALGLYTLTVAPDKLDAARQQLQASPLVESVVEPPAP